MLPDSFQIMFRQSILILRSKGSFSGEKTEIPFPERDEQNIYDAYRQAWNGKRGFGVL